MSRAALVSIAGFYATLFLFTFHEADEDLWGRLAVGRLVAEAGAVPREDVFAYVPTKPQWVDHEWLSGVVFYSLHRIAGDVGLLMLRAATGLGAVLLACAVAVARRDGLRLFAVVLLALAVSPMLVQGYNSVVRAQSFSFLGFALSMWLVRERGARFLWILPLVALWANLHGGFVVGVILVSIARPRWAPLVALASLLNPYGIDYWRYLAGALTMARPGIVEWEPGYPDLHVQLGAAIVVASLGLGRAIGRREALICVGTLLAALLHVRFAPFVALAALAYLPRSVEAALERHRAPVAVLVMTLLLSSAGLGVVLGWSSRSFDLRIAVPADRYPVEAVNRLEASGATGRMAVYFNWGQYVLYRLHPNVRVTIDGRYETVYPDEIVALNRALAQGESDRLLRDHPPDFALYPSRSGAFELLSRSDGYRLVSNDGHAALFEVLEVEERQP